MFDGLFWQQNNALSERIKYSQLKEIDESDHYQKATRKTLIKDDCLIETR